MSGTISPLTWVGAIRSGMQACWIRPENGDLMQTWDSRLLPHLEISRLASLTSLI